MFVLQQSNKITIKEWKATDTPYPMEQDPPENLPANEAVLLVPYGSLFFAAAPLFEKQLPDISEETYNTAVILNLKGYDDLGSTFLTVLERYLADLHKHQSKLMLSGIRSSVVAQLEKTGLIKKLGRENIFMDSDQIGESVMAAWEAAEKWVAEQPERPVKEPELIAQQPIEQPD
jgi:SulP family sulfate permease